MTYQELEKYIVKRAAMISVLAAFILYSIAVYKDLDVRSIVFGWLVGCITQVLVFRFLLCRSVERSVTYDPKHAYAYTYVQYIFRLFIYACILILGFKFLGLNIIAIGAGLLVVRLTILFETVAGVLKQSSCKEVQ